MGLSNCDILLDAAGKRCLVNKTLFHGASHNLIVQSVIIASVKRIHLQVALINHC
jgi:hypothetical protein